MTEAGTVTFKSNANQVMAAIAAKLDRGLRFAAMTLADRVKKRLEISNQGGMFPADPGESPHYGVGDLMRAVYNAKAANLEYHVGFRGSEYARLQEFGGIIRIKNKDWLTVPASPEALAHKTKNRSAREFPRLLHFRPTRRADLAYLVERTGGGNEVIHYLMRKSVYVPAHPTLRPAIRGPEWQRIAIAGFKGDVHEAAVETVE